MYQPRMHFQELGGAYFDGSAVISPLGFPLRLLQYKYKSKCTFRRCRFILVSLILIFGCLCRSYSDVQIHMCSFFASGFSIGCYNIHLFNAMAYRQLHNINNSKRGIYRLRHPPFFSKEMDEICKSFPFHSRKTFTRKTLPTFVSQLINCNLCNHISPPTDNLKVHMYENSTSSRRRVVHEMISTCISYHSMNHHLAQSVFFKI